MAETTPKKPEIAEAKPMMIKRNKLKKCTDVIETQVVAPTVTASILWVPHKWNPWTDKSTDIKFADERTGIGSGEAVVGMEIGCKNGPEGQNSVYDLDHGNGVGNLGKISVKNMTMCDCRLAAESRGPFMKIWRKVNLLIEWIKKYRHDESCAEDIYNQLDKKWGSSKTTVLEGINRLEVCVSNLTKLNEIVENLKQTKKESAAMKSEYITDICAYFEHASLQEKLNDISRKEAIDMTLIIVHKKKGWMIVKDTSKVSCPRITQGGPRIHVDKELLSL